MKLAITHMVNRVLLTIEDFRVIVVAGVLSARLNNSICVAAPQSFSDACGRSPAASSCLSYATNLSLPWRGVGGSMASHHPTEPTD